MKKSITLLFAVGLLCSFQQVNAKLRIPIGEKEVLEKVADLPDKPEFETTDGSKQYINLGRLYTEYNVLWLPIYIVKEPILVGIDPVKDIYYDIPEAELTEILKSNNLDKNELLKLGFFTKYGGKLVAGLIIVLLIYGNLPKKSKQVVPQNV